MNSIKKSLGFYQFFFWTQHRFAEKPQTSFDRQVNIIRFSGHKTMWTSSNDVALRVNLCTKTIQTVFLEGNRLERIVKRLAHIFNITTYQEIRSLLLDGFLSLLLNFVEQHCQQRKNFLKHLAKLQLIM